jgi:hypothetical protein
MTNSYVDTVGYVSAEKSDTTMQPAANSLCAYGFLDENLCLS